MYKQSQSEEKYLHLFKSVILEKDISYFSYEESLEIGKEYRGFLLGFANSIYVKSC